MNRLKRLATGAVAGALAAAMTLTSFAANITYTYNPGGVTNYIKTDSYKGYENFPCWIWYQGYCYYYDQNGNYLTNTTTPDGYTVDELGRWTVNGNPVHNGAGNYKMHTEDYNGKSDDEIWALMKEKLIPVYQDAIVEKDYDGLDADGKQIHIDAYSYGYGNDIIWHYKTMDTYGGYGETVLTHNDQRHNTYVTVAIGNEWSDLEQIFNDAISKASYANSVDIKEKTIKAAVGDKIGTELFNYIKQHADKRKTGGGYISTSHDEHGYPVMVWTDDPIGDGIMAETMDLTNWKNKTTDYGKRFSVDYNSTDGLLINIYNN